MARLWISLLLIATVATAGLRLLIVDDLPGPQLLALQVEPIARQSAGMVSSGSSAQRAVERRERALTRGSQATAPKPDLPRDFDSAAATLAMPAAEPIATQGAQQQVEIDPVLAVDSGRQAMELASSELPQPASRTGLKPRRGRQLAALTGGATLPASAVDEAALVAKHAARTQRLGERPLAATSKRISGDQPRRRRLQRRAAVEDTPWYRAEREGA